MDKYSIGEVANRKKNQGADEQRLDIVHWSLRPGWGSAGKRASTPSREWRTLTVWLMVLICFTGFVERGRPKNIASSGWWALPGIASWTFAAVHGYPWVHSLPVGWKAKPCLWRILYKGTSNKAELPGDRLAGQKSWSWTHHRELLKAHEEPPEEVGHLSDPRGDRGDQGALTPGATYLHSTTSRNKQPPYPGGCTLHRSLKQRERRSSTRTNCRHTFCGVEIHCQS